MLATRLEQIIGRDPEWLTLETAADAASRYHGRYLMLDGAPCALGSLLGQGDEALVFELIELRTGERGSVVKVCRHAPGSPKYIAWAVPYRMETNPSSAIPEIEMYLARLVEVPGGLVKVQPYLSAAPQDDATLDYRSAPVLEKIEAGDMKGALRLANRLVEKHGPRPDLLEARGRCLAGLEMWEEARQVLEQALESQNQLRSFARFRTSVLLAAVLEQIYAGTPGEGAGVSLQLEDGTVLTQTVFMDADAAAQDDTLQDREMYVLLEALADEPFFIPGLRMLVDTLLDTWGTNVFAGQVVAAIEKIDPGTPDALEARMDLEDRYRGGKVASQGELAEEAGGEEEQIEAGGDIDRFRQEFDRAYQPEPERGLLAQARYQSALSHLAGSDLEAAEKAIRQAMQLDPGVVDYPVFLAEVLDRQGRAEEALQVLQQAVQDFPDEALAYQRLGDYGIAHEDFAGAEDAYLRALFCAPEQPWRVKLGLGEACRKLDRLPEALEWLHAAYQESDQDPEVILALFYALCDVDSGATQADIQEAGGLVQDALHRYADRAEFWVCQAQLQVRSEEYASAIASLRQATRLDPDHPFAADFLAELERYYDAQGGSRKRKGRGKR